LPKDVREVSTQALDSQSLAFSMNATRRYMDKEVKMRNNKLHDADVI
jgi:hypothetical protein